MSADPLSVHGLGADLNPYAYVSGQPLQNVDPQGLDPTVTDAADKGIKEAADKQGQTWGGNDEIGQGDAYRGEQADPKPEQATPPPVPTKPPPRAKPHRAVRGPVVDKPSGQVTRFDPPGEPGFTAFLGSCAAERKLVDGINPDGDDYAAIAMSHAGASMVRRAAGGATAKMASEAEGSSPSKGGPYRTAAAPVGETGEGGATAGTAPPPKQLGPGTKFGAKIDRSLASRGWTKKLVQSAIDSPVRTVATRDTRHLKGGGRVDDSATAYYGKRGGYVVRNNRTGDVVQISDRTDPDWKAPWDK